MIGDVIIIRNQIKNAPVTLHRSGAKLKSVMEIQAMTILSRKKCSMCGESKLLSGFYKDKKKPDGLFYTCKQCEYIKHRKWFEVHQFDGNRENRLKRKRAYYQKNKEYIDEQNKKWVKDNPGKRRSIVHNYYLNNSDKVKKSCERWRKNNPEKFAAIQTTRRAKRHNIDGKVTAKEWKGLKKKYNFTCLCCGRKEPEIELTQDHVRPIVLGGSNFIENIQPLCRSCNSKKGGREIDYR